MSQSLQANSLKQGHIIRYLMWLDAQFLNLDGNHSAKEASQPILRTEVTILFFIHLYRGDKKYQFTFMEISP